jgi:thioredoxin reductase (NADPH)
MSHSLVQRIESSPRITLHTHSEIIDLAGDEALAEITWTDHGNGRSTTRSIRHMFVMIGAEPNTDWLKGFVDVDANGFILTSFDENSQPRRYPYATSVRGIFAAGDVRSGSVKRVASSIGEGASAIQSVHRYLNPELYS